MAESCGNLQPEGTSGDNDNSEVNPSTGLKDGGPKKHRNRRRKTKMKCRSEEEKTNLKDEPRVKDETPDERREVALQVPPFTPAGRRHKRKKNKKKSQADSELRGPESNQPTSVQIQGAPESNQPTSVQIQGAPESNQPTSVQIQGAPESNQPTSVQIQGAPESNQPTSVQIQGAPESNQPTSVQIQGAPESNQPTSVQIQGAPESNQPTSAQIQGAPESNQPTSAQIQGAPESNQPTGVQIQGAPESNQPTGVQIQGAPESNQPTSVQIQGAPESNQPTGVQIQGAPESNQPTSVQIQGATESNQPTSVQIQGAPESNQPTGVQIQGAPESNQPTGVQIEAAPESNQPTNVQIQGAPESNQPTSVQIQGASESNQPTSVEIEAAPESNQPTSVQIQGAPESNQPTSVEIEAAPESYQPTSVQIEAAPESNQPTSVQIQDAPESNQPTSVQIQGAPESNQPTSVQIQGAPESNQPTSVQIQGAPESNQPTSAQIQGAPESNQPTSAQIQGAPESNQPTGVQIQGAPESNQPTGVQIQGAPESNQPTSVQIQGAPESNQPTGVQIQGAPESNQPTSVQIQGATESNQPTSVQIQGAPESNQPTGVQIQGAPESNQPTGVQIEAAPESNQPTNVQIQGAPESNQPTSVQIQGASESNQPTSVEIEAAPESNQPTSVQIQGAPESNQPTSVEIEAAPESYQPTSVQIEAAPESNQPTSVQIQDAPESNQPTSVQIQGYNSPVFMGPVYRPTFNIYQIGSQHKGDYLSRWTPQHQPVRAHVRDTAGYQSVGATCSNSDVNTQIGNTYSHADVNTLVSTTCSRADVNTQVGATCSRADVNTQVGPTCSRADVSTQVGATCSRADVNTKVGATCRHCDVHTQVRDTCRDSGLHKQVGDIYRNSAEQCRARLLKHYKLTGSYVQLIPWVNDDKMHIMDIYVKLNLQRTEGSAVARKKAETLTDYEKIFQMKTREGDLINRVIFCGMAGLGKSTLFDKIAYDWAVGSNEVLKKYKLVFVLKMCALDQSSDLIESIFDQILGDKSGICREELKLFIDNNSDEVLILLDGFDELITTSLSESSFGSVLGSLHIMNYQGCIAVTTRPSHLEKLMGPSLVQNPCTHVKVLGFTQNDVKKYISNFFHDDLVSAKSLTEKINSSVVLSDLTKSPMMLLLICLIWREKSGIPETMSQLYIEALTYIFKRKDPGCEDRMSTVLVEIGKVALKGLLANDQKLSFSESDFNKMELSMALKVGILSRQRVLKNLTSHQCIQFIHKTVQEFCAAKYWQSLPKESREFQEILDIICQEGKNIYQFEYLLRFCCGNNQKCLGKILDNLSSRLLDGDGALHQLLIHCYFEAQLTEATSGASIQSLAIPQICVQKHHAEYFKALLHFLTHTCICRLEDRKVHLRNVQSLHIAGICLGGSTSMKSLAVAVGNMSSLNFLELSECSLAHKDIKVLTYHIIDGSQLIQLDLSGNGDLGSDGGLWAAYLKNVFTKLKVLKLNKCNLQKENLKDILMTISEISSLTELDLSGNHSLAGTANVWSPFLLETHLVYLRLSDCCLRDEDLEYVAAVLSKMNTLTHLDLSVNLALGGTAKLWSRHLCLLHHLHKLDLGFCSLKCEDIESIALSVTDLTNMKVIVLAGNRALGRKVQLWATHLCHLQHIEKLDFSKCSFNCKGIEYLAEYLSEMRLVIELDLSNNSALVRLAKDWAPHLCLLTHVQKLDLSGCLLIGKDVEHVALSVSGMSNLRRLVLSMNSKWQGSAAMWSGHLHHMKYLRELCLRCCFLTSTDIEHVAVMLSKMTNLTHLDLSANNTLGGSAHLWSGYLRLMRYLQNLDLSDCSLTGTDVDRIALSIRDMANMSELTLSRNTALGGSAGLWAHQLPDLKYLRKIALSRCFMTCTDKCKISQALGLMTNSLHVTY